jgi:hypothetical protein
VKSQLKICEGCKTEWYWPDVKDYPQGRLCGKCIRQIDFADKCNAPLDGCDEDFMREISS